MTTTADSYFIDVASAVLDEFFCKLGARREQVTDSTKVRYSTDTWFAEVLYLPFDGPKYSPRVEIGSSTNLFDDPRRNRIDVMHTAPRNTEEYDYNLRWRYKNRDELRSALISVRDRILVVHTLQFLRNLDLLTSLLHHRYEVVESEWTRDLNEHNDSIYRAKAEEAFRQKDYEKVVQCYSMIPPERLTRTDRAKLQIATNRKN